MLTSIFDCFSQQFRPQIKSNVTEEVTVQNTTETVNQSNVNNKSDESGKDRPKNPGKKDPEDSGKDESNNSGEFDEYEQIDDEKRNEIESFSRAIHRFSQDMLVEVRN